MHIQFLYAGLRPIMQLSLALSTLTYSCSSSAQAGGAEELSRQATFSWSDRTPAVPVAHATQQRPTVHECISLLAHCVIQQHLPHALAALQPPAHALQALQFGVALHTILY